MEPWLESFAKTNFRRSSDTAHDLKTPLNVAVLNLELLRMRVSKLTGGDDEKVNAYARSIEQELRRMARIFDAFFVLSTPPKGDEALTKVDVCALSAEAAADASFELAPFEGSFLVSAHESRIRQAFSLFFEGAARVFREEGRQASAETNAESFSLAIAGNPAADDFEMTKIFKFYYTDALGNPDLSLAAARLIVETYGGELNGTEERDKVVIRLSFPGKP
ncbi:MAG TPA: histidine kinase dimerization/phospho-acceptor domain-containing protein [Thermoanaerobaculia bacterium]|jgi:nitrogen fixation/metabolism regulation signal transduction histidine kinase|nr:histidine kinase dimerization/phospho-acceptor domain-containing protein [Thermoanaerobaculia bacterium]